MIGNMKLAIVADWLTVFAGAEHVIAELHALWPAAPIFTTVARPHALGPLANADIRTSSLQLPYRILRHHQLLLPWMPRAIEAIDLTTFDVIISSSHAVAKGVIPRPGAAHMCYCHTPMRYAWEMESEYLRDFRVPKLLQKPIQKTLKKIRRWDVSTAKRVDQFIANSRETEERIERTYARNCIVLPPPVSDRYFADPLTQKKREGYLAVGRLVPYKRFDLLINVANRLQLPLTIVGRGQEEKRLRAMAGETVTFHGFVADADLPALYSNARAFLFPPHEDAGLVPLEAQACGTPVIAFGEGGALDTVRDGVTGLFFREQTEDALAAAIQNFEQQTFDRDAIREHARKFSSGQFREKLTSIVEETVRKVRKR